MMLGNWMDSRMHMSALGVDMFDC